MCEIYNYNYFLDNEFENWDPDKFEWEKGSEYLLEHCLRYFNIWWNPDKFNWEDNSNYLAQYYYEYFFIWWDPDKFNWEEGSEYLTIKCQKYFKIWWDPDKFNWDYQRNLILYFKDYFEIWWNSDKFNWEAIPYKYKGKFYYGIKMDIELLVDMYFEYINIWYDYNKISENFPKELILNIVEENKKYNLLDKDEIIKLILIAS